MIIIEEIKNIQECRNCWKYAQCERYCGVCKKSICITCVDNNNNKCNSENCDEIFCGGDCGQRYGGWCKNCD